MEARSIHWQGVDCQQADRLDTLRDDTLIIPLQPTSRRGTFSRRPEDPNVRILDRRGNRVPSQKLLFKKQTPRLTLVSQATEPKDMLADREIAILKKTIQVLQRRIKILERAWDKSTRSA